MICHDKNTEKKIKEAAKTLFLEKGFNLTTSREIVKKAWVNLSLLNYHFWSKKELFDIRLKRGCLVCETAPSIHVESPYYYSSTNWCSPEANVSFIFLTSAIKNIAAIEMVAAAAEMMRIAFFI